MENVMKTYTICGSMRFAAEMREIAWRLETERGWNILQCTYDPPETALTTEQVARLVAAHDRKIQLSDGIYVVNIGGYIGNAVRREIRLAQELGKEIIYHFNR